MRDSRLKLLSGGAALAVMMGVAVTAQAQEPIVLSNDLSMPTGTLQAPVAKPAPAPKASAPVPMAARPDRQVGTPRPTSVPPQAAAVSPPVLEPAPSLAEIEAALTNEVLAVPTSVAPPPTPMKTTQAVPAVAVSTPSSAPASVQDSTALAPVLRAAPPPEMAPTPIAPTMPEMAPPTLRISSTRFVPTENSGNHLPPPTPSLTAPVTVPAPVMTSLTPMPAPQAPAVAETAPASAPATMPIVSVEPGVTVAPKPRLVIEGPAPQPSVESPAPIMAKPAVLPVVIVDTFRARKGEGLRDVIRRWADRAGIDLVWAMPTDIVLEKDFSYVGKFETALNGLISAYPESGLKTTFVAQGPALDMAPKPYVAESAPPAVPPVAVEGAELAEFVPSLPPEAVAVEPNQANVAVVAPAPVPPPPPAQMAPVASAGDPAYPLVAVAPVITPPTPIVFAPPLSPVAAVPAPVQTPSFGPSGRWRALSGASMRQVLQAWAEDAKIPLVWAAREDYVVRYSVNKKSDYGRAVSDLLGQYGFESIRPAGQIYRDPATGQATLVIRSVRG